jgi:glutamate carboxypeptidase
MPSRIVVLVCFLALTVCARPADSHAELDQVEEAIVYSVDALQEEALALLTRAVNLNSGTMNLAGVRLVGELFARELESLGFSTRWIEGAEFERAGHLVATHGDSGPHFLLIGHLDTVFERESAFQSFERVSETLATGPGITDMKGGNVIILVILHALRAAGVLDQMQITVFLTGDEERSGRPLDLARAELIEAAEAADYALGFEDGDGDPHTAVISRRGSSGWTLRVEGTPAHSSQVFSDEVGYGAIYEMARILDRFRSELAGQEYLTFNPGLVLGGTELDRAEDAAEGSAFGKNNVVAAHSVVTGDLRTLSPEQLERTRNRMLEIVADSLPGASSSIEFRDGYPPLAPTEGNRRLLGIYSEASVDLGFGPVAPVDPARAGAADISFCSGRVEGALCGLGLMGTGGHTEEETADLSTLRSQSQRAALLIWRLTAP